MSWRKTANGRSAGPSAVSATDRTANRKHKARPLWAGFFASGLPAKPCSAQGTHPDLLVRIRRLDPALHLREPELEHPSKFVKIHLPKDTFSGEFGNNQRDPVIAALLIGLRRLK